MQDLPPDGDNPEYAALTAERDLAQAALNHGDFPGALRHLTAALAMAQDLDDVHAIAAVMTSLGQLSVDSGDLVAAEPRLRQAKAAFEILDDETCAHWAGYQLGRWALRAGRPAESELLMRASLEQALRDDNGDHAAWCLQGLGHSLVFTDPQSAVPALEDAVVAHRAVDDSHGECWALLHLGQALAGSKRYGEAVQAYESGSALGHIGGDDHAIAFSQSKLGDLARYQGRHDDADTHLSAALVAAQRSGNRVMEGSVRKALGLLAASRGQHPEALRQYENALAIADRSGNDLVAARVRGDMARSLSALGRYRDAASSAAAAVAWALTADDPQQVLAWAPALMSACRRGGDPQAAVRHGLAALAVADLLPRLPDAAVEVQLELSRAHASLGEHGTARGYAREALTTALDLPDRGWVASAAAELGAELIDAGDAQRALDVLLDRPTGTNANLEARVLRAAGEFQHRLGQLDAAERSLVAAEQAYKQLGHRTGQAACLRQLSEIMSKRGDEIGARRLLQQADGAAGP